ncbi:MAG: arsenic resistance protein [Oleiphilaceae bacterium]|nr:arsenic resistance protein [Oleiphilaceae bacterium]
MAGALERNQAWVYLLAMAAGLTVGGHATGHTGHWEPWLWPLLGALLFTTFTQVPLTRLGQSFRDRRFMGALLAGNFVLVPLMVWALLWLLPHDPAIRLGVLLVLLVPCTDWFISFTHLGRGDATRAIAAAPVLLMAQLLLLPLYLWWFMGDLALELTLASQLLPAFSGLILTPLALAWLTQRWAQNHSRRQAGVQWLGVLPVPLLALVVFLIAGSQVHIVTDNHRLLGGVAVVFVLYLLAAAVAGKALGRIFGLPFTAARTLVFSLGTRNSFVMLPLALSLPEAWRGAAVVIVCQSLVELFGMLVFVRGVPEHLIREPTES